MTLTPITSKILEPPNVFKQAKFWQRRYALWKSDPLTPVKPLPTSTLRRPRGILHENDSSLKFNFWPSYRLLFQFGV